MKDIKYQISYFLAGSNMRYESNLENFPSNQVFMPSNSQVIVI